MTEKEKFEQALVNTIRSVMADYDKTATGRAAGQFIVQTATSGNFTDPETSKEYGFEIKIGSPDFWDDRDVNEEE